MAIHSDPSGDTMNATIDAAVNDVAAQSGTRADVLVPLVTGRNVAILFKTPYGYPNRERYAYSPGFLSLTEPR